MHKSFLFTDRKKRLELNFNLFSDVYFDEKVKADKLFTLILLKTFYLCPVSVFDYLILLFKHFRIQTGQRLKLGHDVYLKLQKQEKYMEGI